ncbi:MAG: hypothetical protein JKY57_00620 [Kordiimonadaceae bacterium]|nr:hypothetical protein [Kordiimonadaceae bacterium]
MGKFQAYAYLVDLNDAFALGLSTSTIGASFDGNTRISDSFKLTYYTEYSSQSDYADNPGDFTEDYLHASLGFAANNGLSVTAGYEKLSGNGTSSFKTPLALLHAFQGWADKFLVTPPNGLVDVHVKAAFKMKNAPGLLNGAVLKLAYHDFSSDNGGIDYGTEFDIALIKKFSKRYTLILKGAFYNADQFATDTTKLWMVLATKF